MRRGELWVARAYLYASKARPVLIVQADGHTYDSVIACLLTTYLNSSNNLRIALEPSKANGLREISYLMPDKLFSFAKDDLTTRIGALTTSEMALVEDKLRELLGLD